MKVNKVIYKLRTVKDFLIQKINVHMMKLILHLNMKKAVKEIIKGKVYESTAIVANSTSTPLKVNLVY